MEKKIALDEMFCPTKGRFIETFNAKIYPFKVQPRM